MEGVQISIENESVGEYEKKMVSPCISLLTVTASGRKREI